MASPETIAAGATGNTGALSADTWFYLAEGDQVDISTDGGTTYNPLRSNFRRDVIISSGLTVTWYNPTDRAVVLHYMPI